MGVFPNLEITLRVDRRLDYTCESKNKSKCFVFPVYLVFHPICLKGKWWEGRKGKKCSLCFEALTSPYKMTWRLKPYHMRASPGPDTVLFRLFAMLFQGWSLQVEFWRNYNIPPLGVRAGGCSVMPYNDILLIPSPGFWSELGPQSGMRTMLFHQPPRNSLPSRPDSVLLLTELVWLLLATAISPS